MVSFLEKPVSHCKANPILESRKQLITQGDKLFKVFFSSANCNGRRYEIRKVKICQENEVDQEILERNPS
jgi:hypothetical protein